MAGLKRRVVEAVASRFGVVPIAVRRIPEFPLVQHLERVIERQRVDCVFDVGAYEGTFGRLLRSEVGYHGLIVSFEPQPDRYRSLVKAAAGDANWLTFEVALGAVSRRSSMNVARDAVFSSLLDPHSDRMPSNMASLNVATRQIEVAVERLDELVERTGLSSRMVRPMLKMDTQGYDLEVFEGARNIVARLVALQSEVSVIPIYMGVPSWQQAIATYTEAGFDLSGLFPVSHDDALRAVEFDAIFVRAPATVPRPGSIAWTRHACTG